MSKIIDTIKCDLYTGLMNNHLGVLEIVEKEGDSLMAKVYAKRAIRAGEKVVELEKKSNVIVLFPGVVEEMVNRLKQKYPPKYFPI